MTTPPSLIVGTAGHIDHGKTSMVRVLTGVDLDTLPEEQERGITIALGFTPLDLPDGRRVALVDVPGHEKLVRTMVAGVTGIDAVLLCIAADDGAMPQTREHLAILDLLGVTQGIVVLTKVDLVDEELLELAIEDTRDLMADTSLAKAPILPFSAETGRGRDAILSALAALSREEPDTSGPFRLPVDRTFSRPGFGSVVTGTSWGGILTTGSTVQLLPTDQTARVRSIEVHGEPAEEARPGWRVALNLAGVEGDDLHRGLVVARGVVPCPQMIDIRYRHVDEEPLDDGSPVRMILGTTEVLGRLHLAADREEILPGETLFAQVRLDSPLPCLPGDRLVIRRTSPVETLGGGEVVDPWAPRMRKKNRVTAGKELERLYDGAITVWLDRAGETGLTPEEWAVRHPEPQGKQLGDRLFSKGVAARLQGALLDSLAAYHESHPLSLGAHRRELRRGRLGHLSERVFDALVDRLADLSAVAVDGPLVRVVGHQVTLSTPQVALEKRLLTTLSEAGYEGVSVKALHEAHEEPEVAALMRLVEARGDGLQVPGVGWLHGEVAQELKDQIRAWFGDHDALSPQDFKELTGLSRKTAIPLLEWLDAQRLTARSGNTRIAGPGIR